MSGIDTGSIPSKQQYISFVEGSSNTVPDESSYPLHVLSGDHNLNNIMGGDPTDGYTPWITDILVYPSYEYWETQLQDERIRPYIDLSISDYNTVRIPSAIHGYNVYADGGIFYENVTIHGSLNVSGQLFGSSSGTGTTDIPADLSVGGNLTVGGTTKSRVPIESKSQAFTLLKEDSGSIYKCTNTFTITLPTLSSSDSGVNFTIHNIGSGIISLPSAVSAPGDKLIGQYSSCTIYWDGSNWYGMGDLTS